MFTRFHRQQKSLGRILLGLSLIGAIVLPPMLASAQITEAVIIEILGGDQVFIAGRKAGLRGIGRLNQQISTARSKAGLRLTERGGLRMLESSSFTVGSECVRLFQGKLLITGQIGRNGCVGKVQVRSVGTVYVLEADGSDRGRVTVLEGSVEVFSEQSGGSVPLTAGQTTSTSANGDIGSPQTLSQAQLQTIAGPLIEGFQVPLPDLDKVTVLRDPGFSASFLQDALTGSDQDFDGQKLPQNRSAQGLTGQVTIGTFTRTGENSGQFISSLPTINFTFDVDSGTITSFSPIPGITGTLEQSSVGLSGNTASATAIFQNGQIVRVQVFGVNGNEPAIGQPFPGNLIIAPGQNGPAVRDR